MFTFVTVLRMIIKTYCGSSSVGRASASQAEGHEFESRLPLQKAISHRSYLIYGFYYIYNNHEYRVERTAYAIGGTL